MSREIKFRAWMGDYFKGPYDLKEIACNVEDIGDNILHNKEIIWEQFTGLKDRNGKEIFEGDIVRCGDFMKGEVVMGGASVDIKGHGHEEDWVSLDGCWSVGKAPLDAYLWEVLGNVHENPELLK